MTSSQRLAHVRDRVADLDRNLASALDYISGRKPSRAQDHPGDLGDNLATAYGIARDLVGILSHELDIGRDLELARTHARGLDIALAASRPARPGMAESLELARTHASDLDIALASAQVHELELDSRSVRGRWQRRGQQRDVGRPMSLAGRLLAVITQLLPAQERARYAEEFRSELWEIAHAGGRRRTQLAYATRQVSSAWRLRVELRVPRRRGAAPLWAR